MDLASNGFLSADDFASTLHEVQLDESNVEIPALIYLHLREWV